MSTISKSSMDPPQETPVRKMKKARRGTRKRHQSAHKNLPENQHIKENLPRNQHIRFDDSPVESRRIVVLRDVSENPVHNDLENRQPKDMPNDNNTTGYSTSSQPKSTSLSTQPEQVDSGNFSLPHQELSPVAKTPTITSEIMHPSDSVSASSAKSNEHPLQPGIMDDVHQLRGGECTYLTSTPAQTRVQTSTAGSSETLQKGIHVSQHAIPLVMISSTSDSESDGVSPSKVNSPVNINASGEKSMESGRLYGSEGTTGLSSLPMRDMRSGISRQQEVSRSSGVKRSATSPPVVGDSNVKKAKANCSDSNDDSEVETDSTEVSNYTPWALEEPSILCEGDEDCCIIKVKKPWDISLVNISDADMSMSQSKSS